jgi:histidine triad (HIT) family protein
MSSVFTKIINKEIPGYVIDQNDHCIAILAKGQIQKGHTLIIPKLEIDKFTDMSADDYINLQTFAHQIALKLALAFPNKSRIVMNIVGFEVPHVHIHLIPCNNIEEAYCTVENVYDSIEMQTILELIKNA